MPQDLRSLTDAVKNEFRAKRDALSAYERADAALKQASEALRAHVKQQHLQEGAING